MFWHEVLPTVMLLCGVTLIAQLSLRGLNVADNCTQRDSSLSKYCFTDLFSFHPPL